MTLTLTQVFHAFNARSQRRSAFTSRFFTNGWLWAAVAICLILQSRSGLLANPAEGAPHRPAHCLGLGSDRSLFSGARSRRGNG
jgi:magnesium-transporting ATPase (P-type)